MVCLSKSFSNTSRRVLNLRFVLAKVSMDCNRLHLSTEDFLVDGHRRMMELCWNYRAVLGLWLGLLRAQRTHAGKTGGKGTEVSSMTFSLSFLKAHFEAIITLSDVYILFRCCNVMESDGTCCLFFAALQWGGQAEQPQEVSTSRLPVTSSSAHPGVSP